jgi:ABC-type glycerol-3-phosphate transport system substrate-binding protein
MTNSSRLFTTIAFVVAVAAGVAACGSKTPPRSTTTTRTQSTTTTDTGDNTSSDTKQKTTTQPDGSSVTDHSETTKTTVPAAPK